MFHQANDNFKRATLSRRAIEMHVHSGSTKSKYKAVCTATPETLSAGSFREAEADQDLQILALGWLTPDEQRRSF